MVLFNKVFFYIGNKTFPIAAAGSRLPLHRKFTVTTASLLQQQAKVDKSSAYSVGFTYLHPKLQVAICSGKSVGSQFYISC